MNNISKLIVFILLVAFFGLGLYYFKNSSPSNKEKQDGKVRFSLEGKTYEISGMVFGIKAEARLFEGNKIKTLVRDQKKQFDFYLGPSKKKLKDEQKYLKIDPANINQRGGYNSFVASWAAQINDPEKFLKLNQISYSNRNISLDYFYIQADLPAWVIKNQQKATHQAWFKIENLSPDRITGKFGGIFEASDLNKLGDPGFYNREIEITDGTFDVPLYKYYKYE